jgi:hypothetical protein
LASDKLQVLAAHSVLVMGVEVFGKPLALRDWLRRIRLVAFDTRLVLVD